ncbi:MAG: glycine cleavage system protein GcvH [Chitinophagaceae bacterium]|nr:glycine cleavage system protein GcvH [Chitinophagaceae bacterium]MBP6047256.1 glycine cleavage system protein GcvH [Ferruginibacter sp.]MBK7089904.1 glycine cleavage system protein GcvH [Chitinophagaceae bacterium]MBK7345925.1 glycine cleavage system protein GcvH [Chitinophagaceae bacterium]MBK8775446.1 glycine cleavage system protein GcvH [Chitinophagaceae bacterium]
MSTPENLKYTKDHEWVAIDGNLATIGITHYAQHELGDIVYVDINTVGKKLAAEEIFGTVEAVKTVSDLFLPVSGTITVVNPALEANPELVNSDPYGEGWMVKMEIDAGADLSRLMDATGYNSLIG